MYKILKEQLLQNVKLTQDKSKLMFIEKKKVNRSFDKKKKFILLIKDVSGTDINKHDYLYHP